MSTLSIAPSFVPSAAARPGRPVPRADVQASDRPASAVRLTRRGRVVVVLALLGVALVLMTALGGWAVAGRDAASPQSVRVVTVAPGDTLYSIAGRVAGPGHVREMVLRIQRLNSLPDATIQPGQRIAVPRG